MWNRESAEPVKRDALENRETRTRAEGALTIEVVPNGKTVEGRLLDVSRHGFCIAHQHEDFFAGQEVRVLYSWGKLPARVVWVGTREGEMAAGFRTDS